MTDVVLVAIVAATPPTLAVLLTWWQSKRKLQDVHVLVNSRLTALLLENAALRERILTLTHAADAADAAPPP